MLPDVADIAAAAAGAGWDLPATAAALAGVRWDLRVTRNDRVEAWIGFSPGPEPRQDGTLARAVGSLRADDSAGAA